MYRIFGRQKFNYSTKKSVYITYQFPKWQCVKVNYTEESVPNRKYFLRTNTTIQQVKKAITSWKFHPKSLLSKKQTSYWKHTSFQNLGTRKNVQRFSRSAIQLFNPKKRTYDIHRPNFSDITQGHRTLLKKLWHEDICTEFSGDSNSTIQPKKAHI